MELRHVRAFLALSEELHFGRTAQRLHVAQSAVSQTIKALEQEVGAQLFVRTKRSVALSTAGKEFSEHARRALVELEHAAGAARRAASGETGRLVVRFGMMSSLTAVPRMLSRFRRDRPGVDVKIEFGGSSEQLEAIEQGRCDVGFMAWKKDLPPPLAMHLVERAELVAILPSKHRLAKRRFVALKDLAPDDFIFLGRTSEPQVRTLFARHCIAAGFEPRFVLDVEHLETLLAFVAAGLGVSCAPNFFSRLKFRDVTVVPLRPVVQAGICAVWNPASLSAPGRHFLTILGVSPG